MGRRRQYANDAERQRAHRQKQRARLQATCVEISPNCTLYLGNAYDIVPLLKDVDTLVTDPPYGANYNFAKPPALDMPAAGGPCSPLERQHPRR
jgi:hypothetical protein